VLISIVTHASDPWKQLHIESLRKTPVTSSLIIEDLLILAQGHGKSQNFTGS
jgi:hypothetical protein